MLEGEVVVEVLADVGDHHVGEWQHFRAVHHSIAPGRVPHTATILKNYKNVLLVLYQLWV